MKETTLPVCPGLVVKDGRYYFQARIPQDCLAAWQRQTGKRGPVYTEPLDTRDLMEARRIVRSVKWPGHDSMVQRLRSGPVSTIDDAEVKRLAALWVIERLEENDEARYDDSEDKLYDSVRSQLVAAGIPVPPKPDDRAFLKRSETLAIVGEEMRRAYARGKAPAGFDDEMEDFLVGHGLDVLSGSDAQGKLRRALLEADRKAFDFLERRHSGEYIEAPPAPPAPKSQREAAEGPTLTECYEKWCLKKARPGKTKQDTEAAIRSFEDHAGKRGVLRYLRRDAIKWRDTLLHHPTAPLHPKTVNKKLSLLRAAVQVAIDDELGGLSDDSPNPFRNTEADEPQGKKPVIAYSVSDLNRLFNSKIYTGHHRPEAGRSEAAYWMPLLAMFTGARLEELGQLRMEDVAEERGVRYLFLSPEAGRIKTNRARRVPIHPELIRLGFLDYVEWVRKQGAKRLFPVLQRGGAERTGSYTDSWSKWYGRYLDSIGITDGRIVFHSFRHSFKDACRESGVSEEIHDAFTGHIGRGGIGRAYGGDMFPLGILQQEMQKVTYPEVELPQRWQAPDVAAIRRVQQRPRKRASKTGS